MGHGKRRHRLSGRVYGIGCGAKWEEVVWNRHNLRWAFLFPWAPGFIDLIFEIGENTSNTTRSGVRAGLLIKTRKDMSSVPPAPR
jgi:hypothetical protein